MSENSINSADELLRRFLTAPSEAESAKFFDVLLEKYALPTIEKILRAKFGDARKDVRFSEQDFEDLRGECCLKIVGALWARRIALDAFSPVKDFSAYCAAIAYNCWNAFVRERSPNRESLKNKIRYSLDKDSRFVSETAGDGEVIYRRRERNSEVSAMSVELLAVTVKSENEFFAASQLPDLLALIFAKADGGLKFEKILKVVADLWQVRDLPAISLDDLHERRAPPFVRREDYEMRCQLEYVWREIRALPILQRIALLYNLRDERGGEMLFAFFNAGIAALDELAEAMNLDKTRFAELLPHLPFDDGKIAAAMNLNVKQVGNLRKVARDNLRRRLDGKAKRKSAAAETEIFIFSGEDKDGAATAGEFLN